MFYLIKVLPYEIKKENINKNECTYLSFLTIRFLIFPNFPANVTLDEKKYNPLSKEKAGNCCA